MTTEEVQYHYEFHIHEHSELLTLAASSELSKFAEPMATVKPSGDHAKFRYSCMRGKVSVGLVAL